jgi:hypothetical protein
LKDAGQIREYSAVEIREVMNSKTPKAKGKIGEQEYTMLTAYSTRGSTPCAMK